MLRQVLRFGSSPAVVLVHAFPFWTMETPKSWVQRYTLKRNGQRGACHAHGKAYTAEPLHQPQHASGSGPHIHRRTA
jgi:hypothetical protein